MKLHKALTAAAVAAAVFVPFGTTAGAVTTTKLTILDGYQYDADSLMDHTVCIDGTVAHDGSQPITTGIVTTPGTHNVVLNSGQTDCAVDSGSITGTVDLLDTAAQTLVINWPDWSEQQQVLNTSLFVDDISCTAPGTARIAFRNVASAEGTVANLGSVVDSVKTPLIANLAVGEQGVASVASPTYPVAPAELAAWDPIGGYDFLVSYPFLATAPGSLVTVHAIGGNDGDVGLIWKVTSGSVCETPGTTSTTTTTTTVAPPVTRARAADPVRVQPRYTG
jgi:hypothetical protein